MTETATLTATMPRKTEHFDVLIVGAGISGVGGAYHLTRQCPGTSFVVLEAQESFGSRCRCSISWSACGGTATA
jgi:monoamine oxidase